MPALLMLMRRLIEHIMEQFEDYPLEFIRLDLALPDAGATADVTTRRQAMVQALISLGSKWT